MNPINEAAPCPLCGLAIEDRSRCICQGGEGSPVRWITREELEAMYPPQTKG